MDFIEWTHVVLGVLVELRHERYTTDIEIGSRIFGAVYAHTNEYWNSNHRDAIFDAVHNLVSLGLVDEDKGRWQVNRDGRLFYDNPYSLWESICQQEFDEDESRVLKLVNRHSPQVETDYPCVWLKDLERDEFANEFSLTIPPHSNEERERTDIFFYSIPASLASVGFVKDDPRMGYGNNIKATYAGLAWESRRGITTESRNIDDLVAEWETTTVDFKRQLLLNTKDEKGEFGKDILGLVNTKSSGSRFMIIGFDDKSRQYYGPPDLNVTQDRIEQILSNYTEPMVNVRYEVIDYRSGRVGRLEVIREAFKLPYRAKDDVIGDKSRKRLEKGAVYVRHGSHTETAVGDELASLEEEGRLARERNGELN